MTFTITEGESKLRPGTTTKVLVVLDGVAKPRQIWASEAKFLLEALTNERTLPAFLAALREVAGVKPQAS